MKVGDQVRLIIVAGVGGDAAPVARADVAHCALQAHAAHVVLRPDADALDEHATQMARGDAEQRGGMLDPTLMVEQLNRPTGEAGRRRFDRSRREHAGDALDELCCVVDRNQLVAQGATA